MSHCNKILTSLPWCHISVAILISLPDVILQYHNHFPSLMSHFSSNTHLPEWYIILQYHNHFLSLMSHSSNSHFPSVISHCSVILTSLLWCHISIVIPMSLGDIIIGWYHHCSVIITSPSMKCARHTAAWYRLVSRLHSYSVRDTYFPPDSFLNCS